MENLPPTLGVEDGTTEVECLLVEPQGGHVSMDSVFRIDEKIPHNAMYMKEVSPVLVLDPMHAGAEVGYLRIQNDFCDMGEDYFLGVEFAESLTYLDHGSSEGLHASVSDSSVLTSSADTDVPWKSDCLRIMEVPEYQNDHINISSSELSEIPSCHEGESLIEEKSLKSPNQVLYKILASFRMSIDLENNQIHGEDSLAMTAAHVSQTDDLPALKRPCKHNQRYIDELAMTLSRHRKRKREYSSLAGKDKSLGVNNHKKCRVKSKAIRLPAEESSVRAIQVPFGSLVL